MKDVATGCLMLLIGLGIIYGTLKWSSTNDNWDESTTRYFSCEALIKSELDPLGIKINVPDKRWYIAGHTAIKWYQVDWDESRFTGDEIDVSETMISLSKQYESISWNCMDCDPVTREEEWQLNRKTLRLKRIEISEVENLNINYQCREVEPL
jgi:hypothetical protein